MMLIYLDESGDLGFDFTKRKTTKKFVITLLVCNSNSVSASLKTAVRRTLKNKINRSKNRAKWLTELKGTDTSIETKEYFFKQIKEQDWQLYSVILNKSRVESHLHTAKGQNKLYNFLARFLIEKLPLRQTFSNVRLIVDRSKNKNEIQDFNLYLKNQIEALLPLNTALIVEHLKSEESTGLQAVDLFCWGIARKYERNDLRWYDVFRHKIMYETQYLPDV
jgi:hypothetical protein